METSVTNTKQNNVILEKTVSMYLESMDLVRGNPDFKFVFVKPVNRSTVPDEYEFDEYLRSATRGEQTQEKHDEFLYLVYKSYDRFSPQNNGFWWGTDTSDRPRNLIETYSKRFTDCFGEKGRNLVNAPSTIREIVDGIYVNGVPYLEYYHMKQISKMNFLEVVCEIIENLSRGEIAKSFSSRDRKHMIVTFRPFGKDVINVYLPVSAFSDFPVKSPE
ncbi:hypothetical protein [Oribacterium sp. WCC10]|uniref:hypothetical protein n=1 Tax=Oribacterium sp. WCC10 TaxID=1855343 RepID=UPI0008EB11A9|nr:hypothetical protein [Oribacterium sp. WCC10]SFG19042.1 hypothetical protein SAMN05216356_10345 [Oribacterium sp. WCC10]